MPEIRQDPVSGEWVILAPDRSARPNAFESASGEIQPDPGCPFCPGREDQTPPETGAAGPPERRPGEPGWVVRTFANKYPSLLPDAHPAPRGLAATGRHEVLVETPRHFEGLVEAPQQQVIAVLRLMAERLAVFADDPGVQSVLYFRNFGRAAGASLSHPHSQLMGFPIVPPRLAAIAARMDNYHRENGRCLGCDLVAGMEDSPLAVSANEYFVAAVRAAGRFPFETMIWPRAHAARLPRQWSDEAVSALAEIWAGIAQRYDRALGRPAWNTVLLTAPLHQSAEPSFHWHLELFPRLSGLAGVELGVGAYVNPSEPEEIAHRLREAGRRGG